VRGYAPNAEAAVAALCGSRVNRLAKIDIDTVLAVAPASRRAKLFRRLLQSELPARKPANDRDARPGNMKTLTVYENKFHFSIRRR
jgi:hypothetical protein